MIEVWTEKYRPDTLEEVVGQEEIVERLQAFEEQDSIPHLMFAGPAGTGKCLTEDTPVMLGNGELRKIGELVREKSDGEGVTEVEDLTVLSLTEGGSVAEKEASHVFRKQAEKVLYLSSEHGFSEKLTPEHPLLTLRNGLPEWKEADKLREGDFIAVPEKLGVEGQDREFLEELDGERFRVVLPESFDIPLSETFVGKKREILSLIEERDNIGFSDITSEIEESSVRNYLYEMSEEGLVEIKDEQVRISASNQKNVARLDYCRENNISRDHFEKIVYVNRFRNFSGKIEPVEKVSPELLEFLGFLLAEGSLRETGFRFYNDDEKLLDRFSELVEKLFGAETIREQPVDKTPYLRVEEGATISKLLEQVFDLPFGERRKSHEISLNDYVTAASEESISRFLKSYSDSEACVSNQGVQITTASEEMASNLTYLLKRLGIHSRIKEEKKSASNGSGIERTYHTVLISGKTDLEKFDSEIGFDLNYKSEELEKLISRDNTPNLDIIQNSPDTYREIMDELGIKYKQVFESKEYALESSYQALGRLSHRKMITDLVEKAESRINELASLREELRNFDECAETYSNIDSKIQELNQELEPIEVRNEIEREEGIRSDRVLEYAQGERSPEVNRLTSILKVDRVEKPDLEKSLEQVEELQDCLNRTIKTSNNSLSSVGRDIDKSSSCIKSALNGNISQENLKTLAKIHSNLSQDLDRTLRNTGIIEKLEKLKFLKKAELRWVKIEDIEEEGSEEVYDLTVPGSHNFIAGDVPTVVHNTTSAIALAKDQFGDKWSQNFMETNASDERGIDVVRERIKDFARTKPVDADFKIIFLDEADALTQDAQQALRRTMEQFSDNCRFILSCNYSSKIIDPIQSRCAVFRFKRLEDEEVEEYIKRIAGEEGFKISREAIEAVMRVSSGDLRRVTNILQTASMDNDKVEEEDIYGASASLKPEEITDILDKALEGDFIDAREQLADIMIERGLDGQDVINAIHREALDLDISERGKLEIIENLGEFEFRIAEGGTSDIQIEALLAKIADLEEE
ncbi:MAG: replication factor C small subunit [Candidatus Nanohaloarchaea archaeon]